MERAYVMTSRALSVLLCLVGIAMVTYTLLNGGGVTAIGVVVGIAFAILGAARFYLAYAGARA